MPAYTAITELETDPGAPGTSELWKKWRDNPLAVAEGSTGAPYAQTEWHPYNSLVVGDANTGRIWSFAIDGSGASIVTPDFVDGYEYRLRFSGCGGEIDFVTTVGTETRTVTFSIAVNTPVTIRRPRIAGALKMLEAVDQAAGNAYINEPFLGLDAGQLVRVTIEPTTAFSAGTIYMDKRRVYC